jgi:rubrerythrin
MKTDRNLVVRKEELARMEHRWNTEGMVVRCTECRYTTIQRKNLLSDFRCPKCLAPRSMAGLYWIRTGAAVIYSEELLQ